VKSILWQRRIFQILIVSACVLIYSCLVWSLLAFSALTLAIQHFHPQTLLADFRTEDQ